MNIIENAFEQIMSNYLALCEYPKENRIYLTGICNEFIDMLKYKKFIIKETDNGVIFEYKGNLVTLIRQNNIVNRTLDELEVKTIHDID